ncbi:hypothetical protein DFH28DRAFT_525521 [Melampsora americana]|nr:hypothetical protein DFH28DRAFT_525521 [Melampsora americana]
MSSNLIARALLLLTIISNVVVVIGTPDVGVRPEPRHPNLHGRRRTQQMQGGNGATLTCSATFDGVPGYLSGQIEDCDVVANFIVQARVRCAQYRSCAYMVKEADGRTLINPATDPRFRIVRPQHISYVIRRLLDGCQMIPGLDQWIQATRYPRDDPKWLWGKQTILRDQASLAIRAPQACVPDLEAALTPF